MLAERRLGVWTGTGIRYMLHSGQEETHRCCKDVPTCESISCPLRLKGGSSTGKEDTYSRRHRYTRSLMRHLQRMHSLPPGKKHTHRGREVVPTCGRVLGPLRLRGGGSEDIFATFIRRGKAATCVKETSNQSFARKFMRLLAKLRPTAMIFITRHP